MMFVGGILVNLVDDWNVLIVFWLLVGVGGVILNVVMIKMLVDWFVGCEILMVMVIYLNFWLVGIVVVLVCLLLFVVSGGLVLVWWVVMVVIFVGLGCFCWFIMCCLG